MAHFLYTIIIYPLYQIIEFAFKFFGDVFKDTGISVIGVSMAVSILCLPLYIIAERWQQIERDTEKALEGGVKRIKSVFSGDEQYMILSTYYRQHRYHPLMALRSSFGLLIQIPFFIAAYVFLSNLSALRGEHFLFIRDMGAEDALFRIGNFPVNVLPIAMTLINIVAGAVYTKGFKLKDKLQIYGMALVFLVLLYKSPAGLVLYWTMNNVFSLVKNIFYKIKRPLLVLYVILCVCILGADYFLLFKHNGLFHKRILLTCVISLLLLAPLVVKFLQRLLDTALSPLVEDKKLRFTLFIASAVSLCLLAGFVIPSYVINSSAVEFADIDGYGSPIVFLLESTMQMLGLCVLWPVCIYFLFRCRIQTLITLFLTTVLIASLVNTFCFSGDYGTLSRLITFSTSISQPPKLIIIVNILAMLAVIAFPIVVVALGRQKILHGIVSIVLIAECAVTVFHAFSIQSAYRSYKKDIAHSVEEASSVTPVFHLSKDKLNVVTFMLDRAENAYVKPIFDAYPELYDRFEGFTLYKNTVSYNQGTLLGAPPLFGGYEYTPYEMNKRADKKLVDKHNEALLTVPRILTEQADFRAIVSDLSWANYSWIPDMSICDPYEKITGVNTERKYTSLWIKQNSDKVKPNITSTAIKRNLVWFSLFKTVPVVMRDSVYDDGLWWASDSQTNDNTEFIDYYSGLAFLPELTDFTADTNMYCMIVNETTHSNQTLQAPDFAPATNVTDRGPEAIANFVGIGGNAASFKLLGKWFDYLKANGCYDNTRIILTADHGIGTDEGKALDFPSDWPMSYNPDHLHPLLLVKDFNASGTLTINHDFMTNADVPSITLKDIVKDPINPFTEKPIVPIPPDEKKASGVVLTHNWQPGANLINKFRVPDADWYTISKDMFDIANWEQGVH